LTSEKIKRGLLFTGCFQITVRALSGVKLDVVEVLDVGSALNFLKYNSFLLGTFASLPLVKGWCLDGNLAKVLEKPIRFVCSLGKVVGSRVLVSGGA